jgi:beta-fructofuranosidase
MENGTDYYWVGTFDEATNVFSDANGRVNYSVPSQQCDYGMFYASKSFADAAADAPRLLIGWVGEAAGGPLREWEGIQSTPRSVVADPYHPGRALFQPLPALVSLREGGSRVALPPATLAPGSAAPVNGLSGVQLDCVANFTLPLAPSAFGLSVFVGEGFSLNVTLHVGDVAGWANLTVGPHTGPFPLPSSGPIMLRVLVDHSVVEAFAADGRAVITHRVYPPDGAVGVQVLNSGAAAVQLGGFEGYTMRTPSKPSLDELRAKAASRARATAGRE